MRRKGTYFAVTMIFVGIMLLSCSAAMAASDPAWEIHSIAQPTNFSSDDTAGCNKAFSQTFSQERPCDGYTIIARNSGSGPSAGTLTITDSLPDGGLKPVFVSGLEFQEKSFSGKALTCAEAPFSASIRCSYSEPVPSDGLLVLEVNLTAEGSARTVLNHVSIAESEGSKQESVSSEPNTSSNTVNGAQSSFGLADYSFSATNEEGSPEVQAGFHPYELTANIDFNSKIEHEANVGFGDKPVQEPRDILIYLPPGFVGQPQAADQCAESVLVIGPLQAGCSKSSIVGTATIDLRGAFISTGVVSRYATPIYEIKPVAGYPAEFGFTYLGQPVLMYAQSVWTAHGYGLRVSSTGLPEEAVLGVSLTFFGNPSAKAASGAAPAAFLTNPASCDRGPLSSRIEVDSWEEPHTWTSAESTTYPQVGGCEMLQFNPTIAVTPETTQMDRPSGFEVDLKVPQAKNVPGFLATPDLKNATVTLPPGVSISPSAGSGLVGCKETGPEGIDFPQLPAHPDEAAEGQEIGLDHLVRPAPGHCPAKSEIGKVEIASPLISAPLKGHLYIAEPPCGNGREACTGPDAADGRLYNVYLEASGLGIVIKLRGKVQADLNTGQLTATFLENPQLPFEDLKLILKGGPQAPLANPQTCGAALTSSVLEPWGGPTATPGTGFTVTGCGSSLPFAPSFAAGTVDTVAGGFSPFTLTLSRGDGEQNLSNVSVTMPPGVAGRLATVPLCPEPQAQSGACTEMSRIGTVTVAAGSGSQPLWVSGPVYLTGPYNGAPFGLSIVVPVKAGPFDLGSEIERAAISVDMHTGQVTVASNRFPRMKDGVPFRLKAINVTVDRPGFVFNPTNCNQLQVKGVVGGAMPDGASGFNVSVSSPFAVQGCKNLPFRPGFKVRTEASHSRRNGASLHVVVKSASGQANIREVRVELPKSLPSRLSTLNHACPDAVFIRNPAGCSAQSRVGYARALTSVLPVPLEGPAYFVSHGGEKFPELVVVLQGDGVTIDLAGETFISKSGVTSSTFRQVPDVPVSTFELTLPQGPYSALGANTNLCATNLTMPTVFHAQNGASLKQNTPIEVENCPNTLQIRSHTLRNHTLTVKVSVPGSGRLTAHAKGMHASSMASSRRATLTLKLAENHTSPVRTTVLLTFTPNQGKQRKVLRKSLTVTLR
jgi:hypothetical protein